MSKNLHNRLLAISLSFLTAAGALGALSGIGGLPAFAQAETKETPKTPEVFLLKVKVLDKDALNKLLDERLEGSINGSLNEFANMFFVRSKIDLNTCIGLTVTDPARGNAPLEPAFPSTYRPTLREFLDAIALQIKSRWTYEAKDQVVQGDTKEDKEIEGIANFVFVPNENLLPYEITPAKDWKEEKKTNWIMYVPPTAPMAMDLHILGKLSCDDKSKEAALFAKAPKDAALDNLKRVKPDAGPSDLKQTKVGPYNAYYFEHAPTAARAGKNPLAAVGIYGG